MAQIYGEGFEMMSSEEYVREVQSPSKNNKPASTLGNYLIANSKHAIENPGAIRAGICFISPEGAFEIDPIKGEPTLWVIRVILPSDKKP